jgi:hypothetical protein
MVLNASYVCLLHSPFIENHPIWILEDGPLISEVGLSHHHRKTRHNLLYGQISAIVHSHLRRQGACRNSAPSAEDANLYILGHTPYQCLLSCHPIDHHLCFRPTHRLRVPAPLHAGATLGTQITSFCSDTYCTSTSLHDGD